MQKVINTLMILVLLVCLIPISVAFADDMPSDLSAREPYLHVINTDLPEVKIGEDLNLALVVENSSIYTARDVRVIPELENTPFQASELMTVKYLDRISSGKTAEVDFTFHIDKETKPGVYPLKLMFEYRNLYKIQYGRNGDKYQIIYIEIKDQESSPEIVIANLTMTPNTVEAGDKAQLSITLQNEGTLEAKQVDFALTGLAQDSFSILNGTNKRQVESLASGEAITLTYELQSSEQMKTGGYALTSNLVYEDVYERSYTADQDIFLAVQGQDDADDDEKTVPKIIVFEYGTNPPIVRAGHNFGLSLTFMNTSKVKTVRNIKAALSVNEESNETGNIFTPVNSSNTLYIDDIAPKGTVECQIPFYAVMDAKPKTYNVIVTFEYEDEKGNAYTATEEIGIPVIQQPRLEASQLQLPEQAMQGRQIPLMVEFYNMGRTTIYNLMVKIEGDFDVQTPNYFVGNFNSGNSDYFDTTLTPLSEGKANGRVVYEFEDAAGDRQEIVQTFSVDVMPMEINEKPGGDFPMPTDIPVEPEKDNTFKKLMSNKFFWIGAVVLLAVLFGVRKWRKNKKLMKELTLDE